MSFSHFLCSRTFSVRTADAQDLPGNSWFWGGTPGMSHRAVAWRRTTSFVSEERRKEKEADRQSDRAVVGIEI